MSRKLTNFAVAAAVILATDKVVAQEIAPVSPSRIAPRPERPGDTLQPPQLAPPLIDLPTEPSPSFSPVVPLPEERIFVSEFNFVGNTVFSDEQLAEIAQPYLQRQITFSDLVSLRTQITDLYVDAGYTTSGAFVPPEGNERVDLSSGNPTIQIVEGGVEEIEFIGDDRLEWYIRSRLEGALSPLNQTDLEEALRLLQVDPLINNISVDISAGSRPGFSTLTVKAISQPSFQWDVGANNGRVPSIGSNQLETQLSASNLLSLGERFTVGTSITEGSSTFNAGVEVPVNANNGTVAFSYAQINAQIVEDPLDEFDIESDGRVYDLSFRQPIVRRIDDRAIEEFSVGLNATRLESKTTLSGLPFAISPGADEDGETRITEISAVQEYSRRAVDSAFLVRSRLSVGIDAFDATVGGEPDAQYIAWVGQAGWLQTIGDDMQLLITGDIQLTGDQLVPLSQFSLGGSRSIRGYRQDALISDSGASLVAELSIPVVNPSDSQQINIIPFAGAGIGWNNSAERAIDDNFIAAIGIGAQYEWNNFITRANYAVPFTKVGTDGDSLQEEGFDFELRYQLRF